MRGTKRKITLLDKKPLGTTNKKQGRKKGREDFGRGEGEQADGIKEKNALAKACENTPNIIRIGPSRKTWEEEGRSASRKALRANPRNVIRGRRQKLRSAIVCGEGGNSKGAASPRALNHFVEAVRNTGLRGIRRCPGDPMTEFRGNAGGKKEIETK